MQIILTHISIQKVLSHKFQFPSKSDSSLVLFLQQCSDSALSNKTEFPTFARTMQPSNRIAKSIVSVLNHFQWNRVVSLVGEQFMSIYNDFEVISRKNCHVNKNFSEITSKSL